MRRCLAKLNSLSNGMQSSFIKSYGVARSLSTCHSEVVELSEESLELECGGELPAGSLKVRYASWGLEDKKKPVVFIMPSMSNTPFAIDAVEKYGEKGWWNHVVGFGKKYGIDLNHFAVICASPLGSPFGSTSPLNYGTEKDDSFPVITPLDMARLHGKLLDFLEIERVHAVVGGSMGGMQALQFANEFPKRFGQCAAIAATHHTSPGTVALRSVQRKAVRMNPEKIEEGMRLARMMGMIGYRSREEFDKRFSWDPDSDSLEFEVESYLNAQADRFTKAGYDSECWLTLSKAMDLMSLDPSTLRGRNSMHCSRPGIKKEFMLLPYTTDRLMPPEELITLASELGRGNQTLVHIEVLPTEFGHDAFLVGKRREATMLCTRLKAFLEGGVEEVRKLMDSNSM